MSANDSASTSRNNSGCDTAAASMLSPMSRLPTCDNNVRLKATPANGPNGKLCRISEPATNTGIGVPFTLDVAKSTVCDCIRATRVSTAVGRLVAREAIVDRLPTAGSDAAAAVRAAISAKRSATLISPVGTRKRASEKALAASESVSRERVLMAMEARSSSTGVPQTR